jgi:hypothetical protein
MRRGANVRGTVGDTVRTITLCLFHTIDETDDQVESTEDVRETSRWIPFAGAACGCCVDITLRRSAAPS